ncbi:MAG: hypothetical protein NBV60_05940 [Erythrobacter sp.]|nr:hypothetical protein [Erythrobacter sp.]
MPRLSRTALAPTVALLLTPACAPEAPARVLQSCTSESGQSQFIIDLDRSNGRGKLRYQFFGQDVLYRSDSLTVDGNQIRGTAVFEKSATGEVRGSPVKFAYDFVNGTLIDKGAAQTYTCDTLQDRSLVDLPDQTNG